MKFRKSKINDIDDMMHLIESAQNYLEDEEIPQWNNGYPNKDILKADIEQGSSYVLVEDGKIVGTLAAIFGHDETYDVIDHGDWLTEEDNYVVIHRVAVDKGLKGQGIAPKMFKEIEKMAKVHKKDSIRIDTHKKNDSMLSLIEKLGFRYCGIIYVDDGSERVAYERVLNN